MKIIKRLAIGLLAGLLLAMAGCSKKGTDSRTLDHFTKAFEEAKAAGAVTEKTSQGAKAALVLPHEAYALLAGWGSLAGPATTWYMRSSWSLSHRAGTG